MQQFLFQFIFFFIRSYFLGKRMWIGMASQRMFFQTEDEIVEGFHGKT